MKKKTRFIIEAVSLTLNMALTTGGYLLSIYILAFIVVSPLWYMIGYILINIALIIYNVTPLSDIPFKWIRSQITAAYLWFKYRPIRTNDGVVYQAIIIN